MPSLTAAQTNWALLPGPDSLVATPLGHLREVAAFRIVRDVQVSKYRAETIERVNAAVNWQNALNKSDSIAVMERGKFNTCMDRNEELNDELWTANEQLVKWKPWQFTGKVFVVTVVVVVVVKGVMYVYEILTP
mgnify:FL=1